ncbi:MAG: hypothetical protein JWL61_615, partial [Gemmatimonadetes bacterium]|nr:hypothetical protein [Gemmatimonadota bacterium]
PDLVHLLDEILGVERPGEDESDGAPRQGEVLLDGVELGLGGVGEAVGQGRQAGGGGCAESRTGCRSIGKGCAGPGRLVEDPFPCDLP